MSINEAQRNSHSTTVVLIIVVSLKVTLKVIVESSCRTREQRATCVYGDPLTGSPFQDDVNAQTIEVLDVVDRGRHER